MKAVEIRPSAAALIESLRDFGYSLETAISDIIDNSITAQCSNVWIYVSSQIDDLKIAIIDDGNGMDQATVMESLPPGSRNPVESRARNDLGRFGLGMKTASFSQCRKMTVVSKQKKRTSSASWDLDYVARVDAWMVLIPESPDALPWADRIPDTGTMILWENLDRLVEKDQGGASGTDISSIERRMSEVCDHIALVFHRFLSPEPGVRRIQIFVNDRPIEAFDPFNSRNPSTVPGPEEVLRYNDQEIRVRAFTLPHHNNVSKDEWNRFGGRDGYLRNQGFYVYRQRRLILHGTWFGLIRPSAYTQLSRVRIDIDNSFDGNWKIDVKKSSAQLPEEVRRQLKIIAEQIVIDGKRPFTKRGNTHKTEREQIAVWNREVTNDSNLYRVNTNHPLITAFSETHGTQINEGLQNILEVISSSLPIELIIADFGTDASKAVGGPLSDSAFDDLLRTVTKRLMERGCDYEQILKLLVATEPFKRNQDQTAARLNAAYEELENAQRK